MARIDDYNYAAQLASDELIKRDPAVVANEAGGKLKDGNILLSFLNEDIIILWPDLKMKKINGNELSPTQSVLLLHYLIGAGKDSHCGEWIAFHEIPEGKFYLEPFNKRAQIPLLNTFGENPELLTKAAEKLYNAVSVDIGDVAVVVKALPLIPMALVLWRGDEDFQPEAKILFDKSVKKILSAEDAAWLAGMLVYPLIGEIKKS